MTDPYREWAEQKLAEDDKMLHWAGVWAYSPKAPNDTRPWILEPDEVTLIGPFVPAMRLIFAVSEDIDRSLCTIRHVYYGPVDVLSWRWLDGMDDWDTYGLCWRKRFALKLAQPWTHPIDRAGMLGQCVNAPDAHWLEL